MLEFFFWIFAAIAATVGALALVFWLVRRREAEWTTRAAVAAEAEAGPPTQRTRYVQSSATAIDAAIAELHGTDEGFSFAVFEDFLYALFAEVHSARGRGGVDALAPYLAEAPRAALAGLRPGLLAVRDVIVGAMRVESVALDVPGRHVRAEVTFTACYTEVLSGEQGAQSFYVVERWSLSKSVDRPSRTPEKARVIGCPCCGAPLEKEVGERCRYCGETQLDRDWTVEAIAFAEREARGPILTGYGQELGTDAPTLVAEDAARRFEALCAADPTMSFRRIEARVEQIFFGFHEAWSNADLREVRPLLSDALFSVQGYWIAAYRAQGLRNTTSQRRLLLVELARVTRDKWFDSVTVRVFASAIDVTVDARGAVVGGDPTTPRRFSEYWTLLRARGVSGGDAAARAGCPNCGAPNEAINMAGHCEKCGVKMTMGEFDWVLSRIEQDEVYAG